jgi:hypothetical protein
MRCLDARYEPVVAEEAAASRVTEARLSVVVGS